MLGDLGRRIERLLYFGLLLILLGVLSVYFAAAASYFASSDTRALDAIAALIERNKAQLESLFRRQSEPLSPTTDRQRRTASLRKSLGLPSEVSAPSLDASTYRGRLYELASSVPDSYEIRDQLSQLLDTRLAPAQILEKIKAQRDSMVRERGIVLGVELPRSLTLQYGTTDFRVPSQLLAAALLLGLYLLSLAWAGSFYITRQRELLMIRGLNDYKASFPHILNAFAVDFSGLNSRLGIRTKPKSASVNLRIGKVVTTAMRCLLVVAIIGPILFCVAHASLTLFAILELHWVLKGVAWLGAFLLLLLALMLVLLEVVGLHGKHFYE
jgi:hypothetical protein